MAFKNETKEPMYEYVLNDVKNIKQFEDGHITFTAIVNGIALNNLRVVETADDWFVAFPSRKGTDGKYYKYVYFPIDNDIKKMIGAAIEKALK